jgi:hypothetical protein
MYWLRHYGTSWNVAGSSPDEMDFLFQFTLSFQPEGVDSAFNRNEYQESFLGVKGWPASKADNITAICEPIL